MFATSLWILTRNISRRTKASVDSLNERIAKATGSVGLSIRGLDLPGTILARVRRWKMEQPEAGPSGDTLRVSNYTSNYRAAIRPIIYAPSQDQPLQAHSSPQNPRAYMAIVVTVEFPQMPLTLPGVAAAPPTQE